MFTVLSLRYLDGLGSSPELTIGLLPQRMFHEPGRGAVINHDIAVDM